MQEHSPQHPKGRASSDTQGAVCVFCGSNAGINAVYAEAARELAREMARRRLSLVYGGGSVGLMGILADEVLAGGGRVMGVIPRTLMEREVGHRALSELHVVETMHERKALMAAHANAFLALPGGLGTLEELFEVWTWAQLGIHARPVGLLNVNGFFDPLLSFLDHAEAQGFLRAEHRGMLLVDHRADNMLDRMADYVPPRVSKWLDRGQI